MSLRKTAFVTGEYYHLYNRGNSKQLIFRDENDYSRFLYLLYVSNTKLNFDSRCLKKDFLSFDRGPRLVSIGVYCLMPNHFHLVVTQTEKGSISKFIQKLTTAYSMYYNKKYNRTGSLFEGKFKSQYANSDRYLKYLFSYLHLNPVKILDKNWRKDGIKNRKQALEFLKNYKYSSYQDYLGIKRPESAILNTEDFPNYFPTKEKFQKEIFEWLLYGEKDL
jgi:putative transposase